MAKPRRNQSAKHTTLEQTIRKATRQALHDIGESTPEAAWVGNKVHWPVTCTVGPGLEGAIACESSVGYVNGARGNLIYRGYDVVELCESSTFEEVAFLLLYGDLPTRREFESFNQRLVQYRFLPHTLRMMMSSPLEQMHPMAALRLGTILLRQRLSWRDQDAGEPEESEAIAADEDTVPSEESEQQGESRAEYQFRLWPADKPQNVRKSADNSAGIQTCLRLISGIATLTAAIARIRNEKLPIDPDPSLGYAANLLYMMHGIRPSPEEARILDIALILHADHGMNASTFAAMVVASTMADIYASVTAGIGALSGPLHGGANEAVIEQLQSIGDPSKVKAWVARTLRNKQKVMGFGHRVYKAYDPRARILGPLAKHLSGHPSIAGMYQTATTLEKEVVAALGRKKAIFPNVDFYSGLVYQALGIPQPMFTPMFAVSRMAGWTARVFEYLKNNRIFRPRAIYTGPMDLDYVPMNQRNETGENT